MGTSTSAAELAGKFSAAAREINDNRDALNKVGQASKATFTATAAGAGVGPAGRSKVSRSIKARYDITSRDEVLVRYTGPAHLVNNTTNPHEIAPRDGEGAVLLADGNFRAVVDHPGTRGKRFFEQAREIVERTAPRLMQHEMLAAPLRKIFK